MKNVFQQFMYNSKLNLYRYIKTILTCICFKWLTHSLASTSLIALRVAYSTPDNGYLFINKIPVAANNNGACWFHNCLNFHARYHQDSWIRKQTIPIKLLSFTRPEQICKAIWRISSPFDPPSEKKPWRRAMSAIASLFSSNAGTGKNGGFTTK